MKQWRFEISSREGFPDVHGKATLEDIRELGIDSVENVGFTRVFLIDADFDEAFAEKVAKELLSDNVCEDYYIGRADVKASDDLHLIEVHLKSGVTDPVSESVVTAIKDMGKDVALVRTAKLYAVYGKLDDDQIYLLTRRALANDCIEEVVFGHDAEPPSPHVQPYKFELKHLEMLELDNDGLVKLSADMDLFLNLREMQAIQAHYKNLDREPTDIELETLAQTWSEHCVHKTLKSRIDMEHNGKKVYFKNLIKETVFQATQELDKDWCVSVFEDNAGVVEFDDEHAMCFKVETHNHPSALDPYGGASTGIGGVVRDPMGTGLGAKPVANTDVFCFANPDSKLEDIPKGVLHPKRIMKGVVSGVRDYGNRMGIPTVNGAIYFDDRYMANPLVFCGTVGLVPRDKCFKNQQPGDLVMVVGGKTGRDGIHGATFSSGQMTHEHENIFSHAVQIGDAITEKKALDTLIQVRDKGLYTSITDCGAGGLSSAVGEMGEKLGVKVDLEKIPLKYKGLSYTEMWISEAQERMVIAVKPENLDEVQAIFDSENVSATVIGTFTGDKKLTLKYEGTKVAEMDCHFLHNGIPQYARVAKWNTPDLSEPKVEEKASYNQELLEIFSSYNVASKEWVIRQYDHEVQGGSVIKPLVGIANDGPGDASVIRPKYDTDRGIAVSCGMNPMYGDIDPYWMTLSGIDEAIRNIVSVGGRWDRIAILDNYCWGNCNKPEVLGALVRASQACKDGAIAYGTPFISGKDSLNNEFVCEDGTEIGIPSTMLISAISLVDDVNKCITMDAKEAGNLIFVVGLTKNELGGSHFYHIKGELGANVPTLDLDVSVATAESMSKAIASGLIRSCHDCSEGGLAVALGEMAFSGGLGIEADVDKLIVSDDSLKPYSRLFSESNARYVVEVEPSKADAFKAALGSLPFAQVGSVVNGNKLVIKSGSDAVIDIDLDSMKNAWQKPLNWK